MSTSDRIAHLVEPILHGHDHDLYDVEVQGATVRILVDREGGVALDALETLSREISAALDEDDPLPDQRWYLEVSSPGLERPLRRPEHFSAAVGETVKVKTHPHVEGDRRVEGRLTAADDEGVTVEPDGGEPRHLVYADVESARTVFEWGPTPKPGAPKKNAKKRSMS